MPHHHYSHGVGSSTRPTQGGNWLLRRFGTPLRLGVLMVYSALAFSAFAQTDLLQPVIGEAAAAPEDKVKAAMLYEFLGYTEWPSSAFGSPDAPYRIGVLRAESVAHELQDLTKGDSARNRPVQVVQLEEAAELGALHMLFVGEAAQDQLEAVTEQTKQRPILIVTESAQGKVSGSMINLHSIDKRIGFEVHLPCAEQRQLKLSARLLSVATSVTEGEP